MATDIRAANQDAPRDEPSVTVDSQAILVLVAGMAAAWFSAGSTGLLAHSLGHALTLSALAVAIVAAWPKSPCAPGTWLILAGGVGLALLMTGSTIPTINVLAVVVVLAAIAQISRGLSGRVALLAALAAGALAVTRFVSDSIPTAWLIADLKGWILGRLVGWLTGSPLEVGATFGGLDFLVLMSAVYAGWLICTAPPRRARAIWAAVAIVAGHFAYLTALAHSEKLLDLLPPMVLPVKSDSSHVGIWTWSNGLRMLIPWNLPLIVMGFDMVVAAVMFRGATWLPVIEVDPEQLKKQRAREEKEEIPGSVLAMDMLFRFGPAVLAVFAALLATLGENSSDLRGRTIVAYEKGFLNWNKPEYDSKAEGFYGVLPLLVEDLGGKFTRSKDLSAQDLAGADVLVLLHPNEPFSDETLERVWDYVKRGGSLLVAADPVFREGRLVSSFNDVLEPTAMRVRYDTAVTRTGNWEQSYQVSSHPAVAGIDDLRNRFGFELGSSIQTRWPARPVLVGRWGWSDPGSDAVGTGASHYNGGELLGDLVLAAEQSFGQGRVFVLGGASPLQNETLANSYPFVGRLLGYLANKPSNPQLFWRQFFALAAVVAMAALVAVRPATWQLILTSSVMALSLACCTAVGYWSGEVLPDGRGRESRTANSIAYIDASHLDAYSDDPSSDRGITGLMRALMRHGCIPLLTSELTAERLQRASILVLVAPAQKLTAEERDVVKEFVAGGGTLICMVGAEEASASESMLSDF